MNKLKDEILQKLKQRKPGANVTSTLKDYKQLIEKETSWMGDRPFSEKVVAFLLGLKDWPKCKVCGKSITNKHFNLKALLNPEKSKENGVYPIPKYCSPSCQMKDKELQVIYRKKYWDNKEKQKKKVEKMRQTLKEKYGVENISQLEEVKQKKLETLQKHYNFNSWSEFASYAVKKKLEKYGFIGYDNSQQLQRAVEVMKEKFGGYPFQNKKILQKALQKTKKKKINKNYLTEDNLYSKLVVLFGKENVVREYKIKANNRIYFVDFYIKSIDLFVEFDGYQHFSIYRVIKRDKELDKLLGKKLIRIPYFIQLNSKEMFKYYFNIDNIPNKLIDNYPHGFIDKKAKRPKDFIIDGLKRFRWFLDSLPKTIVRDILDTMDEKDKEVFYLVNSDFSM